MPPKTPKAKPRPVPRRGIGATAPDTTPGPMPSASPGTTTSANEAIQTQAPIAPPAGRLDSLVSSTSSRTTQSGIVGEDSNGRGIPVPLKFKPRNVPRKSKEEREALDAKFEAILTPIPRPRGGASSRGPRGGRGGRGGRSEFGGRNDRQVVTGASGPFSLGSVTARDRAQKIAIERGSDFGKFHQHSLGNTKLGKATGESFLKLKPGALAPDDAYSASSSDSEGPRMDVEYISLLDDTKSDDEKDGAEIEPIWGAGAPVRVPRIMHIYRTTQVNTEASSSRKGKLDLGRRGKGFLFEEAVKVEDEPPDGGEDIALPDARPSSDAGRKKNIKIKSPEAKTRDVPVKTRRRSSSRRKKMIASGPEDREELDREELDRAATLRELVGGVASVRIDDDGDIGIASEINQPPHHRNAETENQIFLFQFPNILPQLVLPIKEHKQEGNNVETPTRSEPAPEEPPHRLPPKRQTTLQRKLSAKAQQIVLESFPPPGIAGKLRIHRSGRMTMFWGNSDSTGTDGNCSPFEMDMTRGTQCEFLQELVVMKQYSPWGDQDVDERGKRKGVAFSLGQVKGKFIVSPDFEKLLKGDKKMIGKGKDKLKRRGGKEATVETADL